MSNVTDINSEAFKNIVKHLTQQCEHLENRVREIKLLEQKENFHGPDKQIHSLFMYIREKQT